MRAPQAGLLAAATVLTIVVSACGVAAAPAQSPVVVPPHDSLDARQHAVALRIAHREAARPGRAITVATATLLDEPVRQPNTKWRCRSTRLVRVTLIGDFPDLTTAGVPPAHGDGTVHAVVLTADPQSGRVCLLEVRTGHVVAGAGAVVLFRG